MNTLIDYINNDFKNFKCVTHGMGVHFADSKDNGTPQAANEICCEDFKIRIREKLEFTVRDYTQKKLKEVFKDFNRKLKA